MAASRADLVLIARYMFLGVLCLTAPPAKADEQPPDTAAPPPATTDSGPKSADAKVSGPRVVVRLKEELFAPLIDREIDETRPVEEVVLGTHVRGRARIQGRPTLVLTDNDRAACFDVQFTGSTVSRTVGQNGPATIQTRADTSFGAAKRVTYVMGKGFRAEPARVNVNTWTTTEDIRIARRGPLGIVQRAIERRAWEEVNAVHPQVQAIARERAKQRITAAFDRVLDARLEKLNQEGAVRRAIGVLMAFDGDREYTCCTRGGCVEIAATRVGDGPMIELPEIAASEATVQIWLHKSLVGDNVAEVLARIDQVRESGLGRQAIDLLPPALRPDLALQNPGEERKLDYAAQGDWVVVDFRPDAERLAERIKTRRR